MRTQQQMLEQARSQKEECDKHFLDLLHDEVNPLTNTDLVSLVNNYPERWGRYEGYIGKLPNH